MSSPAAGPTPGAPPPRPPLVSLRATWPLFVVVALVLAGAAFVNSYTELACARAPSPGGGACTMRRGSWAFDYTETFFVNELVGATVEGAGVEVPNRAQDGGGERVYVRTKSEAFRFIDNDRWTRVQRVAAAADVDAFVADPSRAELRVVFDRRAPLLLQSFGVALVVGVPWTLLRAAAVRRRRT